MTFLHWPLLVTIDMVVVKKHIPIPLEVLKIEELNIT